MRAGATGSGAEGIAAAGIAPAGIRVGRGAAGIAAAGIAAFAAGAAALGIAWTWAWAGGIRWTAVAVAAEPQFGPDEAAEPQLDPWATGAGAEPQLEPFDGTEATLTGENVAGIDEIARGFVNGMTFADTGVARPDRGAPPLTGLAAGRGRLAGLREPVGCCCCPNR